MSSSDIQEVPPADIPLQEGYVGNLTDDQFKSLVKMWESYFDICDRAKGQAEKGAGFKEDKTGSNLKKSGIPDDDAAKDEAKKQQEQQGMNQLLEEYGSDALRNSWWQYVRGDSPDGNMLKFVRARKGDVERSLAMMATCLKWRLDTNVESLILNGDLTNGKEVPKFIEQQKSGKVFSLGCTSKEQPICYVIMKYHSLWGQPAASMQKFIVTQMETFRLLMHPPNDKATIFFDLKGFGLKQMDVVNLLYLVKVLESYYPETLGTMYVSNAPSIFWGFWRLVKPLLDPVVRDKIVFIAGPDDTKGDVPSDLMIEYCGGKVKNTFDFVNSQSSENDPTKDERKKDELLKRHRSITDKYEEVTREWCKSGGNDDKLQEQRSVLTKKIRLSQFECDPFTRGLSVYHRNGVLPPENPGISVFDYEVKGETTRRQILGRKTCRKSIERQLFEIVKNGATCKQAEDKIAKDVQSGSWGEWRINDNSSEVKQVALASLLDLDNTGKVPVDKVDANYVPGIIVAQTPKEIVEDYRKAAKGNASSSTDQRAPPKPQQRQPQQQQTRQENGNAAAAAAAAPAKKDKVETKDQEEEKKGEEENAGIVAGVTAGVTGITAGLMSALGMSGESETNEDAAKSNGNGEAKQANGDRGQAQPNGRHSQQSPNGRHSQQSPNGSAEKPRDPLPTHTGEISAQGDGQLPGNDAFRSRKRGSRASQGPSGGETTNYAKQEKAAGKSKGDNSNDSMKRSSSILGNIKNRVSKLSG